MKFDGFKEAASSSYDEAVDEYEGLGLVKTLLINFVSITAGVFTATLFYKPAFTWMVQKLSGDKSHKAKRSSPLKDPIQKELEGKIFDIGFKRANSILESEASGAFLIRRAGFGYVLDIVEGPKQLKRIVFDVKDGVIHDERNRKFFSLGSFIGESGGKVFVIPPKG